MRKATLSVAKAIFFFALGFFLAQVLIVALEDCQSNPRLCVD